MQVAQLYSTQHKHSKNTQTNKYTSKTKHEKNTKNTKKSKFSIYKQVIKPFDMFTKIAQTKCCSNIK